MRTETSNQPSPFLPELEALRGLAALAVVVEHSFPYGDAPTVGWFQRHTDPSAVVFWLIHFLFNGRAAVVLFFVISGFVLARQLEGLFAGAYPRLQSYFIRRVFRIGPAMWTAVLFGYVVAFYFRSDIQTSVAMLLRTLFLQEIALDVPLWSLQVEIVCCTVFPLLYLFNLDASRRAAFGLVLLLAPLLLMPLGLTFSGGLRYLVFFQLGILVGTHGAEVVRAVSRRWRPVVFVLSCVLLSLSFQLWPFFRAFTFFDDTRPMLMAVPFSFFVLAYVVHGNDRVLHAILHSRLASFLGKISYSLYLTHYVISNTLWPVYVAKGDALWDKPLLQCGLFFLIVLVLALPLATLMYYCIELPFSNLGRRLSRRLPRLRQTAAKAA